MDIYSIRSLFSHPTRSEDADSSLYEERVTIWYSDTIEGAIEKAECEARDYAEEAKAIWHGVTDSFKLFDEKVHDGSEVWSVMRDSRLSVEQYTDTFILTSRDRAT